MTPASRHNDHRGGFASSAAADTNELQELELLLSSAGHLTSAGFQLDAWNTDETDDDDDGDGKVQAQHTIVLSDDDDDDYESDSDSDSSTDSECSFEASLAGSSEEESRLTAQTSAWSLSDETKERRRHVRFCKVVRVTHFVKSGPEDWPNLYYSAHELQKAMDEYTKECGVVGGRNSHHHRCMPASSSSLQQQQQMGRRAVCSKQSI